MNATELHHDAVVVDSHNDLLMLVARRPPERWASYFRERWLPQLRDGGVDVQVLPVFIDDELVNTLGAGDFFGEFAALEWAAGYTYPRLASVVASEPLRVLVFPDGALNELVREFPALDAVIRTALHERLPRR